MGPRLMIRSLLCGLGIGISLLLLADCRQTPPAEDTKVTAPAVSNGPGESPAAANKSGGAADISLDPPPPRVKTGTEGEMK